MLIPPPKGEEEIDIKKHQIENFLKKRDKED